MKITTDSSMVYGIAKAFGSWDNVIIEPDEANTILVARELLIELSKAKAATERVRELHKPIREFCIECSNGKKLNETDELFMAIPYPCPTIQALDGE